MSFRRPVMLRNNGNLESQVIQDFGEKFAFFKTIHYREILKFCCESIHHLTDPRLVCKL